MPGKEATSINFKVIDLSQPEFEPAWSESPDLPKREENALLIRSSRLVVHMIKSGDQVFTVSYMVLNNYSVHATSTK